MTIFRSKLFRHSMLAAGIIICCAAIGSYFYNISISLRSSIGEESGRVAWVGGGAYPGAIALFYEDEPEALDDAHENAPPRNIPGRHIWRIRKKFIAVLWQSQSETEWWFHFEHASFQMPMPGATIPTTLPATAPAITYLVHYWRAEAPSWLALLIAALYPGYRIADVPNRRRRKRFTAGQCVVCGYDLRHSPERCPECGAMKTLELPLLPMHQTGLLGAISRELWLRIVLVYPVLFVLFAGAFREWYFWHYKK